MVVAPVRTLGALRTGVGAGVDETCAGGSGFGAAGST
jgi:hypothetical protein